jgi:PAS domain S-box-containing protein
LSYRHLFDTVQEGILILDAHTGVVVDVNPFLLNLLGFARADFLGKSLPELKAFKHAPTSQIDPQVLLKSESLHEENLHLMMRSGQMLRVELTSTLYADDAGSYIQCLLHEQTADSRLPTESQTSWQQIENILESVSDSFVSLDTDWVYTYVNQKAAQMFGRTREQMIGKHIWTEFPEGVDQPFYKAYYQAVETGQPIFLEEYYPPYERWFENRIYPSKDGLSIFFHDITDRKQAEKALRDSEIRYQNLTRVSPVGIFRTDQDGTTTYVNPKWCQISGLSSEQALGDGWLNAVHPDDKEKVSLGWRESTQRHAPSYTDYRFVQTDGSITWVMGQAVPERNSEGQIIGYVGMITDITERKKAEAAMQASERQLSLIYSNTSDVLFYLAVEARQQFRFISVNSAFLKSTGLTEDQVAGKLVQEVIPESALGLVLRNYKKAVRTKKEVAWEEITVYPAGTKYGEVSINPLLDVNGDCTHLIGTVHDITFRKQAEQEISKLNAELELRVAERTAQLQAANKELETFSYSVSHDLRAPLRAISGFSQIIARRHRAALNEEGRHYFDNIVQASDRMSYLIEDLLKYSRLGRKVVRRDRVQLASLINEIVQDMQPQLEKQGGRLFIVKELPDVTGDSTLLSQIFTNLLENAFKYHKPGVAALVTLDYHLADQYMVIEVQDNGIGIPLEHQEKIFNMFQRLHSEEEYPGTGIGLATVRKSVELLGGSVKVKSNPGQGSTFSIRLPKE